MSPHFFTGLDRLEIFSLELLRSIWLHFIKNNQKFTIDKNSEISLSRIIYSVNFTDYSFSGRHEKDKKSLCTLKYVLN